MIDEEGLQENSARVGEVFMRELMKLRDEFEVVGDVRGKGLMIGVELVKDRVRGRNSLRHSTVHRGVWL